MSARDVRTGLKSLAELCRGALYLEIVTREDWEETCDRKATDDAIYMRKADWYRKEISRYFTNCGGGVFIPKDSPIVLYELERA